MRPVKDPEKVATARENRLKLVTAALSLVTGILTALTALLGLNAKNATNKADDSEQRVQALQSTNAVLVTQSAEAQRAIAALQAQRSVPAATQNAPARSASPSAKGVLFEGQVMLKAGIGIDLDAKQSNPVHASGPDGDVDVYHDYASTITVNGGDLYPDSGPTAEAAVRCAGALEAEVGGVAGDGSLNPGDRFCLRTSQGHDAWLRINSVTGTASSHLVVFNVVVWN